MYLGNQAEASQRPFMFITVYHEKQKIGILLRPPGEYR